MIKTKIITPTSSAYNNKLPIGQIQEQPHQYKPGAEIVYRAVTRYTYPGLYKRISNADFLIGFPDAQNKFRENG